MRHRPKSLEQLTDDPALLFHAHYLVGAASMAAYWMTMQEDAQTKAMGKRLEDAVAWFYVSSPTKGDDVGAWPSEAETRVK